MIHLDTSFVIDLLRSARRKEAGPALELLGDLRFEEIRISVHAICELYVGVERSSRSSEERVAVERLLSRIRVVYPDERFAPAYARLFVHLQQQGKVIGSLDLLIATSAVLDQARLVTANRSHFSRVPGLELVTY